MPARGVAVGTVVAQRGRQQARISDEHWPPRTALVAAFSVSEAPVCASMSSTAGRLASSGTSVICTLGMEPFWRQFGPMYKPD